jgi:hypothetical protein
MKTDCDTFLTPAFTNWFPDVFHVGVGGYAHDASVRKKLLFWVSKKYAAYKLIDSIFFIILCFTL